MTLIQQQSSSTTISHSLYVHIAKSITCISLQIITICQINKFLQFRHFGISVHTFFRPISLKWCHSKTTRAWKYFYYHFFFSYFMRACGSGISWLYLLVSVLRTPFSSQFLSFKIVFNFIANFHWFHQRNFTFFLRKIIGFKLGRHNLKQHSIHKSSTHTRIRTKYIKSVKKIIIILTFLIKNHNIFTTSFAYESPYSGARMKNEKCLFFFLLS